MSATDTYERRGSPERRASGMNPRFLFYSNEKFGLGHLRRTLVLAEQAAGLHERATCLVVTGSTAASYVPLPTRVDTMKLPTMTRSPEGDHRSRRLALRIDELHSLRSELATTAARAFQPAVAVVDKSPLGQGGELKPALEALKSGGRCKLVLGLRDIEDNPTAVRREWTPAVRDAINRYYDAVLVYGPESSMDAINAAGWGPLDVPIHHVGYVGAAVPEAGPVALPAEYVLATVGGGGDGFDMLAAFLQALRLHPLHRPSVIVTGPEMELRQVERLEQLAEGLDVFLSRFRADMPATIAGARAIVTMAGYNTVCEMARARTPALIVPRVQPREEQLIRARGLVAADAADMIHPADLTPATMRRALDRLLARPRPQFTAEHHDGALRTASILSALAETTRDRTAVGERRRPGSRQTRRRLVVA